jgi:hypothetical protein
VTPSWLYEIPTWVLGLLIVGSFIVLSVSGLLVTRPLLRRLDPPQNDLANYFLSAVGVFYALLIGLIAVAVWEDFSSTQSIAASEAVSISEMYRDLEGYASPDREILRGELRRYVENVLEDEWPLQRRGEIPKSGTALVHQMVLRWARFEPRTEGQKIMHAECMRQLNAFLGYRRERLEAVDSGLPLVMWFVVLAGAAVTIGLTYFFRSENRRLQIILTAALATMIGLVIFLIVVLDRPLVGEVSVEPDGFRDVLTRIMDAEPPTDPDLVAAPGSP